MEMFDLYIFVMDDWIYKGTPFSGGLHVDWVGYWVDSSRFHRGISEHRCDWIIIHVEGVECNDWLVAVRRFHELRGRLGFMS